MFLTATAGGAENINNEAVADFFLDKVKTIAGSLSGIDLIYTPSRHTSSPFRYKIPSATRFLRKPFGWQQCLLCRNHS